MKPLFTFLFFSCILMLSAQPTMPYELVVSQDDYEELTNDTMIEMAAWDNEPYGINVPYGYTFMAHALVSLEQIGYGAAFLASAFNGSDMNFLVPYGIDVIDASLISDTDMSSVSYKTVVTAEDTAFVVQFKNLAFFNELEAGGDMAGRVNFQLRFFKNSEAFQIKFGPSSISDETVAFGGFSGPPVMFTSGVTQVIDNEQEDTLHYNYATTYYLSGSPDAPQLMETNSSYIHLTEDSMYISQDGVTYLTGQPASGTTYTFIPNTSTDISEVNSVVFDVYPSPTQDFINIQFPEGFRKEVFIYNAVGQRVMSFYANRAENFKKIDVHNLVPGIYLIHAGDETRKFIKK